MVLILIQWVSKPYNFAFQTADSGLYRDVWSKIKAYPDNLVNDPLQGAFKAQKQNFIYITEVTAILQYRIWSLWLLYFHRTQILISTSLCQAFLILFINRSSVRIAGNICNNYWDSLLWFSSSQRNFLSQKFSFHSTKGLAI